MLLVYFLVFQSSANCTVTRSLNSEHLVARIPQRLSRIFQNCLLILRLFSHCFILFLLFLSPRVWNSQIFVSHLKLTVRRWLNRSFVGPAGHRKLLLMYSLLIFPTHSHPLLYPWPLAPQLLWAAGANGKSILPVAGGKIPRCPWEWCQLENQTADSRGRRDS